jgi:hypothetical protein
MQVLENVRQPRVADFHIFLWGGCKKFSGGGDDHVQGWIQGF